MITRLQLRRLIMEQARQSVPLLSVGEDPTNPDHSYETRMGADEKWMIYVISGGEDVTEEMKAAGATIYTKKFSTPDEARYALANMIGSPMNESPKIGDEQKNDNDWTDSNKRDWTRDQERKFRILKLLKDPDLLDDPNLGQALDFDYSTVTEEKSMKITKRRLRKIISEEITLISESSQALPRVFRIANRAIRGGRILTNPSVDSLFDAGLGMTSGEIKSKITTRVLGLNALELGLVGLAIGVPALFFDEYSNAQKGDEMARFMAKSLRRPIEMKDLLDPRDPGNRDKIVRQGGSLKSNPILYLASQENTNTAAELFEDEVIAKDVFKVIHELHQEKLRAVKQLKTMKSQSSNEEEDSTEEESTS